MNVIGLFVWPVLDTVTIDMREVQIFSPWFYMSYRHPSSHSGISFGQANATNTIWVTIEYRIGALSMLVGTNATGPLHGNYGIADQRLALQVLQCVCGGGGGLRRHVCGCV
jgi:hypothetical protein